MRRWCVCVVLAVLAVPAWAQVRVVSWNVAQTRGEPDAMLEVITELDLDDHAGFATPVAVMVCQEVTQDTYDTLLVLLGADWSSATYSNDNEDNYGGAQACFFRPTIVTEDPTGHDDLYTQAGRRCDRWLFTLADHDDPIVPFYVYSAHLKAGNNSSSESDRETGANRILQDLMKLPEGTRAIVAGDMNFYDNAELGYTAFIDYGLIDPLGTDSWGGAAGALKHSQSPRTVASGGLASGGLDDRFDFQLHTQAMSGTGGMSIIDGTYRSVGNDGNHYNIAINDGTNFYYPADPARSSDLADALHDASDHLPVTVDYRLPAVLSAASQSCDGGTVISGATLDCLIDISNAAVAETGDGAAVLDWSLTGTGACASNVASGTLEAGDTTAHAVEIDTSGAGAWAGEVELTASDPLTQGSPFTLALEGTSLRPAQPSFSASEDLAMTSIQVDVDADSGAHNIVIPIWNRGWDSGQARLDVDGASTSAPLSCVACQWSDIAGFPANLTLSVDTTGLEHGEIVRWVVVSVSDQDLPGETDSVMHVTVFINVSDQTEVCAGDIDGDGVTDIADLLALLDAWGTSGPAGDIDDNGVVDIEDLLAVISDFGCS